MDGYDEHDAGGHDQVHGHAGYVTLTRRELVAAGAVGAAGAAVAITGCAPVGLFQPAPTTTRTPFRLDRVATLYADGTVPRPLRLPRCGASQAGRASQTHTPCKQRSRRPISC